MVLLSVVCALLDGQQADGAEGRKSVKRFAGRGLDFASALLSAQIVASGHIYPPTAGVGMRSILGIVVANVRALSRLLWEDDGGGAMISI
jgi:hypothetical protein